MTTSAVTTFGVFKSLLTNAVSKDTSLDTATKASVLARINALPRGVGIKLDFSTVESFGGLVTVDDLAKSIEVASGATGTNRVEWDLLTFSVPTTVSGTLTATGFLPGHVGASANPPVADADIAMEYRFSDTDNWKTFDRSTVLEGVTTIQFAAAIADQGGAVALPVISLIAQQE